MPPPVRLAAAAALGIAFQGAAAAVEAVAPGGWVAVPGTILAWAFPAAVAVALGGQPGEQRRAGIVCALALALAYGFRAGVLGEGGHPAGAYFAAAIIVLFGPAVAVVFVVLAWRARKGGRRRSKAKARRR